MEIPKYYRRLRDGETVLPTDVYQWNTYDGMFLKQIGVHATSCIGMLYEEGWSDVYRKDMTPKGNNRCLI